MGNPCSGVTEFVFAVIILGNSCCNWGPVLSGVGVVEPVKSGLCYADGSSGSPVSCEYTKNNVVLSFKKSSLSNW